jgi:hypothetical protein
MSHNATSTLASSSTAPAKDPAGTVTLASLDEVIRRYTSETVTLSAAFNLISDTIADNLSLTDDQAREMRQRYGEELEQVASARLQAVT